MTNVVPLHNQLRSRNLMVTFPHLDESCSECGHRAGVHYAASNADEAFGTWCSESGCVCGTDPNAEWIGTQLLDRYPAPGRSTDERPVHCR